MEDEADLVATYRRLLRRAGHRVVAAGTRAQGLAALYAEPFELVITDLRLPDGSGLDVVRSARTLPKPPPVVVVTGFPSEAGRAEALALGATAYLGKPFAIAAFTGLVGELLAAAG